MDVLRSLSWASVARMNTHLFCLPTQSDADSNLHKEHTSCRHEPCHHDTTLDPVHHSPSALKDSLLCSKASRWAHLINSNLRLARNIFVGRVYHVLPISYEDLYRQI